MLENCCQDLQVTANQGDLSKYSGLYHPSNVETTNKGKNIGTLDVPKYYFFTVIL